MMNAKKPSPKGYPEHEAGQAATHKLRVYSYEP